MVDQIEALLNAPTSGAQAPTLEHMEDTLTVGYAQALALEAERWRLESRIGEVARRAEGEDVSDFAAELRTLARRITNADGELTKLRGLLGSLHERTRLVRSAPRRSA